ncbi:MAG: rod shape-determining protein MreC [Anaerolineae bacterium]|nr:rod shape-determining protein MreC [Anaerolineae bacterium]
MNQGSRRGLRSNKAIYFTVLLVLAVALIGASQSGLLSPIESVISIPLNAVSQVFNTLAMRLSGGAVDLAEIQSLQERNAELESALARLQAEVVELREVSSDYQRLADLVDYTSAARAQQFVSADVIASEETPLRTVTINRGTRDGLQMGMPVVTAQGLVGRIIEVQSNAARVLLVTDPSSAISARLQTTRAEGTVAGLVSGNLEMSFIPLGETIPNGDLVITSGLGGNLPPDLVIGQVTSSRQGLDLYQIAQVRSLIDFDELEIVLVMTNFQPVDLSEFARPGS